MVVSCIGMRGAEGGGCTRSVLSSPPLTACTEPLWSQVLPHTRHTKPRPSPITRPCNIGQRQHSGTPRPPARR
eukprot:2694652-Rhodomonas_salina.2